MADVIAFAMGNFTLTFLVLGMIAALIAVASNGRSFTRANLAEALLAYFILFSVAISFFYNFVFHVFFGELAASFIGWADSPFQAEVGYASLGFAVIGLIAFKGNCMLRLAAILGPAMFQWGAAVGHIHDMMATGNMAPGNAGIMLYSDILLPIIGLALLWFKRSTDAACSASAMASDSVRG
ncbi:MAG: hypothetical protein K8F92_14950 [Hyphomicrobium sp.]|uniref:DUF6790 family protein n=1 Tax=Hyphomicrobium sp. TaxID=82 RepID=UPI001328542F|nr:DUF6790 family protein [Hyphomicrobium sp.]KAB2941041.1 MAG: hypothetical protein F9K20_10775 [Hyphomicrobium sp.]MBZ0210930.1 hypothetical protein [Hyphomicrobium sp.]